MALAGAPHQPVRFCVSVEKSQGEFFQRRYLLNVLLRWLRLAMDEQHTLARLGPLLRRLLARRSRLLALANHAAVRELDSDVHLPAAIHVRSHSHAHRRYSFSDGARFWSSQSSSSADRIRTR